MMLDFLADGDEQVIQAGQKSCRRLSMSWCMAQKRLMSVELPRPMKWVMRLHLCDSAKNGLFAME
jgi:hypothetical protein